jgi:ATP synthase protein I
MSQIKRKITYIDAEGNKKNTEIVVKKQQKKDVKWVVKYMNVGYYLAVPLIVGVFLGGYLDTKFKTKPVLTLALIVLGMIAAFYNLYKIIKDA